MTKLSSIAAEATRLVRRLSGARRLALQGSLAQLCEDHWRELRGPEPAAPLAHTLWANAPPPADLCADLCAQGDARLAEVMQGHGPAQAFALLALRAIEQGDAEGVQAAHAPMMLFQNPPAGECYAQAASALLHGAMHIPRAHQHAPTPPLERALGLIVAHTGRLDTPAILAVIRLLLTETGHDEALERLRAALLAAGVRFTGLDDRQVRFDVHGHAHEPVGLRRLTELLAGLRARWLA